MKPEPRRAPASFTELLRANLSVLAGSAVVVLVVWLGWRWLAPLLGFGR